MYVCMYEFLHFSTHILAVLTMIQDDSRWPFIAEACFKSQTCLCGIFGNQNDIGRSFLRCLRFYSYQYRSINGP